MTTTFRAHFDGKVIVPDEPVELPVDEPLEIRLRAPGPATPSRLEPTAGLSLEERRERARTLAGRVTSGKPIPLEALRREHLYDED